MSKVGVCSAQDENLREKGFPETITKSPGSRFLVTNNLDPQVAGAPDPEYYARVKEIHETGGHGSIGYRAPFSDEESKKLLLRTHTTAVSTAMLYQIANQEGGFKPSKMFSIDRVFR